MAGTVSPKAAVASVLAVNRLQLDDVYERGPTIFVFFDGAGSEF
jgi:hypothetical protein